MYDLYYRCVRMMTEFLMRELRMTMTMMMTRTRPRTTRMMMMMMMIHDKLIERYDRGMVCLKTNNATEKKHRMMMVIKKVAMMTMILQ